MNLHILENHRFIWKLVKTHFCRYLVVSYFLIGTTLPISSWISYWLSGENKEDSCKLVNCAFPADAPSQKKLSTSFGYLNSGGAWHVPKNRNSCQCLLLQSLPPNCSANGVFTSEGDDSVIVFLSTWADTHPVISPHSQPVIPWLHAPPAMTKWLNEWSKIGVMNDSFLGPIELV